MEIYWFDELTSTQEYLTEQLKNGSLQAPVCIACNKQTHGQGSRGRTWHNTKDALLFSFAISGNTLPVDLCKESASIYFMYLFKLYITEQAPECWFKWPNDIYVNERKVGGAITSWIPSLNTYICGIGINLTSNREFTGIEVKQSKQDIVSGYLALFQKPLSWKQIFSKFEVEFLQTKNSSVYRTVTENHENVTLNHDGSLSLDDTKVFSLR